VYIRDVLLLRPVLQSYFHECLSEVGRGDVAAESLLELSQGVALGPLGVLLEEQRDAITPSSGNSNNDPSCWMVTPPNMFWVVFG